ncbi:type I-E CRISPR-associated protein Cas7/Cse4/CasC [Corynebacterium phocae]|uniref:type I-E CRISPR-associated protein Cas7/Cse4/CasC n=1 Tax=Corynebacterium phocae TaxID=161895 RepID=UPI000951C6F5|nr:type I-E CRISPR-associated protein Cas7/Cse4/CasC [Corynebacterium phocae]KAA8721557.1 hypothetical protein F4V58_09910 [Corynebacterium phocae]
MASGLPDAPDLNADACCQVAHAIGVHPLEAEFDYFTAVDDNAPEDNAGAGMIGTIEYNASTLYRYATINVPALIESLGSVDAAAKAVAAFAESFAVSMPTGKQNTFANRTRPEFFAASIRTDQPVNLVGAFEDAVNSRGSRVAESVSRLVDHSLDSDKAYGASEPAQSYYLATGNASRAERLDEFGDVHTLPEIIEILEAAVQSSGKEN